MENIWYNIYNYFILPLIFFALRLAGIFNKKIKDAIDGRKRLFEELIISLAGIDRKKKMIWFHSSSMGEFEQAKPIIQKIKGEKNVNIIVTFFSPSGYKNSLNYPYADIISYLPFDTQKKIKHFLKLVKPDLAVFMRYDIWPNSIWELGKNKTPIFIVDATMKNNSPRKLPISLGFHKELYKSITKILTVSQNDLNNFLEFNIKPERLKVVGDTRYDRVYLKSLATKELLEPEIIENKKVFIFGSSWEQDEEVLLPAIIKTLKYAKDALFIIVPHEPTVIHLEKLEYQLQSEKIKSIRFSHKNDYNNEPIIIVDSIGILLSLYKYADAAYVGGSFKQGIHNVLEPAVYGIPILFGPKIENSQEALRLVEIGCGIRITNTKEVYRNIRKILLDDKLRKELGNTAANYVKENLGATDKLLEEIYKSLNI